MTAPAPPVVEIGDAQPTGSTELKLIRTGGGSYSTKRWEHDFAYIGSQKYSQTEGNFKCVALHRELRNTDTKVELVLGSQIAPTSRNSVEAGVNVRLPKVGEVTISEDHYNKIESNTTGTFQFKFLYARDGKNIYRPKHIWYHRDAGICIANSTKYWWE